MAKAAKKAVKQAAPTPPVKAATKKAAPAKKVAAVKKTAPIKKVASAKKSVPETMAVPAKKAPAKAAAKKAAKKSARKPNAAFMAPLNVSPVLADVVGKKPLPRTEIIKKIWDYIKKNNLQDKVNRRMINADEKLGKVFGGVKQVSMFELAKIVNNHIQK